MGRRQERIPVPIENQTILLTPELVELGEIKLDADNPRIRHHVERRRSAGGKITQAALSELIWEVNGVEDLYVKIRENGGAVDPIIIRHDGVVVEGNCRTVAYLRLNELPNDDRWGAIAALRAPCRITWSGVVAGARP